MKQSLILCLRLGLLVLLARLGFCLCLLLKSLPLELLAMYFRLQFVLTLMVLALNSFHAARKFVALLLNILFDLIALFLPQLLLLLVRFLIFLAVF